MCQLSTYLALVGGQPSTSADQMALMPLTDINLRATRLPIGCQHSAYKSLAAPHPSASDNPTAHVASTARQLSAYTTLTRPQPSASVDLMVLVLPAGRQPSATTLVVTIRPIPPDDPTSLVASQSSVYTVLAEASASSTYSMPHSGVAGAGSPAVVSPSPAAPAFF